MISSPPLPVDLFVLPDGDVLMLPAVWPVRLTPDQQVQLAEILLARNERANLTDS